MELRPATEELIEQEAEFLAKYLGEHKTPFFKDWLYDKAEDAENDYYEDFDEGYTNDEEYDYSIECRLDYEVYGLLDFIEECYPEQMIKPWRGERKC